MVRYTEKLLEKGVERKRLTSQLATLVGAVANDVACNLPEGSRPTYEKKFKEFDTPNLKGTFEVDAPWWSNLEVVRIESNLGEAKYLALSRTMDKPKVVFVPDKEPGTRFFLDNDPRAKVWVASAEDYLKFANSIPEIMAGFEKTADELSKILREAFGKLKEIASTKA